MIGVREVKIAVVVDDDDGGDGDILLGQLLLMFTRIVGWMRQKERKKEGERMNEEKRGKNEKQIKDKSNNIRWETGK